MEKLKQNSEDLILEKINSKWIDYVIKYKLFEEGHFHLSSHKENPSRMHGWINTHQLIQSRNLQNEILKDFAKVIAIENFHPDITLGIGVEGNILGINLITNDYLYDSDYSYLPLPGHNHNFYEERILLRKRIEFSIDKASNQIRSYRGYRKLLVIINVVHLGITVKSLISDILQTYKFSSIEDVLVVSIFNVNQNKNVFGMESNILSISNEFQKNKLVSITNRYLCHFPIPHCPYSEGEYKNCVLFNGNIVKIRKY